MPARITAALLVAGLAAAPAWADTPETIHIGMVPVISAAATYLASDKGYFREAGLDVRLETIESSAGAIALLATDRVQVVEGGVAIGYFNAVAQKLPVILALERGSSPLNHDLMLRPGLKGVVKGPADLKGRSIALVAPGSIAIYEVSKVLESAHLTLKDVDVKYVPFPQMGIALQNGAVDVANTVPPFGEIVVDKGFGVKLLDPDDYIRPQPMVISAYMANTDWTARHPDLARRLFRAIARGAREYCQAYHHGPNRGEVMDVIVAHGAFNDRALLDRMPWQARDPNGRFNVASVLDEQDWFLHQNLIAAASPEGKLVDTSFAEDIAKTLPPFELANKDSKLAGCR